MSRMVDQTFPPHALRNETFALALLDPDTQIPEGVGKNGTAAPKRFSVYRNNVVVSLMEALAAAYPSILAIMGQENFDKIARVYVAKHPPKSAMMQKFGREFPVFLKEFKPLSSSPFLVDLAKAERAWLEAWHAIDEMPLSAHELAAVDSNETMNLVLIPMAGTELIRSQYPVSDLFGARDQWPLANIDLKQGQNLLVTRPHLECLTTQLDQAQADFVTLLQNGWSLGEAISETMGTSGHFDPAEAIALLLQTGAFQTLNNTEQTETITP